MINGRNIHHLFCAFINGINCAALFDAISTQSLLLSFMARVYQHLGALCRQVKLGVARGLQVYDGTA